MNGVPLVKRGFCSVFQLGFLPDMSQDVVKHRYPNLRQGYISPEEAHSRRWSASGACGSTIRRGAFISAGVVCMPPMYINVGAHIGKGTMVDSHALVGSCAQIGERVHLSAAAQIGGVLEPVNASPVVVEDDVIVGGNCGIYEGTVVRSGAVIGAGVVLTRGTPVFDLVRETVYRGSADKPLEIPADAVVVPGARSVTSKWGKSEGLSLQTPVIVKYRDDKTDSATALEGWLR